MATIDVIRPREASYRMAELGLEAALIGMGAYLANKNGNWKWATGVVAGGLVQRVVVDGYARERDEKVTAAAKEAKVATIDEEQGERLKKQQVRNSQVGNERITQLREQIARLEHELPAELPEVDDPTAQELLGTLRAQQAELQRLNEEQLYIGLGLSEIIADDAGEDSPWVVGATAALNHTPVKNVRRGDERN